MRGFDRERAGWARCASVPVKVAAVRSGTRPQKWAAPIVDLAQEEAASALFTVYMQWSAENGSFVRTFGSPAQPEEVDIGILGHDRSVYLRRFRKPTEVCPQAF